MGFGSVTLDLLLPHDLAEGKYSQGRFDVIEVIIDSRVAFTDIVGIIIAFSRLKAIAKLYYFALIVGFTSTVGVSFGLCTDLGSQVVVDKSFNPFVGTEGWCS